MSKKMLLVISAIIIAVVCIFLIVILQKNSTVEISNKYIELTLERLYELSDLIVLANINSEAKEVIIEKNNISTRQYEILIKQTYKGDKKDKVNILQTDKLDELKLKNNNEILLFLRIDEITGEYRITGGLQGLFEYNSEEGKFINNKNLMIEKSKIIVTFNKLNNK